MRFTSNIPTALVFFLSALLLTACGGGGGTATVVASPENPTQIIVSFAEGLFNSNIANSPLNKDNYNVEYCTVLILPCPADQMKTLKVFSVDFNDTDNTATLNVFPTLPGITYHVSTRNLQDNLGNAIANSPNFSFTSQAFVVDDTELATSNPRLISATSLSNTQVLLVFDKEMGVSAENQSYYIVTQYTVNTEVGRLIVHDANFQIDNGDHYGVILTTSSQNEVTYRITVSSAKDSYGNTVASFYQLVNESPITFVGSPPGLIDIHFDVSNYIDANDNHIVDAGDIVFNGLAKIVLVDLNGDGIIDNWTDADNNAVVSQGDIFSGMQDSDGDGLTDSEEVYGTNIFVELSNGQVKLFEVSSDPSKADTDGDGLNDFEETNAGTNPRKTDTDNDGLSDYLEWNVVYSEPTAQDTDQDGFFDGVEHDFYHTSPLLADTDGDQLSDGKELLELNRDPRIADLPEVHIIVGQVRLQIDERYSYTDESGETVTIESSSDTSLVNSQDTSFSQSSSEVTESMGFGQVRAGYGTAGFFGGDSGDAGAVQAAGAEITIGGSSTATTSFQTDKASALESQQTYAQSFSKAKEYSTTSTVTREIVGARIDVDLSLRNVGSIPFTISNIEITVLQQVGNQEKFLPVATLVSNSELITGTPLQLSLGAFNDERGPLLFTSRDVFPNLVQAIMRNPAGLVFRVANYDVVDELGRNYAFINQVARDRTGSIVIDYGDAAAAKRYLVATNGAMDSQNQADSPGGAAYVGGFNAKDGRTKGLPIHYVVQNILGISRHDSSQDRIDPGSDGILQSIVPTGGVSDDVIGSQTITAGANGRLETRALGDDFVTNPTSASGIVAGLNKTADSIAQGDDIQLVPRNTTGLSIGTIVIDPGANHVLDTRALDDDRVEFVNGYETSTTCSASSNKGGRICLVDTDCECQANDKDARCNVSPAPVANGSCSGPQNLVRVNSMRNGDYNRLWFILTTGILPDAADFDQIVVDPGDNLTLAFLQDLDSDGIPARVEFLHGSTDSSTDDFYNDQFNVNFNITAATVPVGSVDGYADSKDSDRDGLSDYAEIFVGWKVSADGGPLRQVFSSPRFRDTDGDNLQDKEEQDLRSFCIANDPRKDALCQYQSEVVPLAEAIGIIAGKNGIADTTADASDDQLTPVGKRVSYGTPVVGPGVDGVLTTIIQGDDVYESASSIPPATDPGMRDTDQDGLDDGEELTGFSTSRVALDGGNGIAETQGLGDDIQRAFVGNPVRPGGIIMLPGPNGVFDSEPSPPWYYDDFYVVNYIGITTFNDVTAYIFCGENNIADTLAEGDDSQFTPYGDSCGPFPLAVADSAYLSINLDTKPNNNKVGSGDDYVIVTDSGSFVKCGLNLISETEARFGDTQLVPPGSKCSPSLFGENVVSYSAGFSGDRFSNTLPNNINARKASRLIGDDYIQAERSGLVTDPLRRDTDSDAFADGYEVTIGADPTVADDSNFTDSDKDGLTDIEETSLGWIVSIDGSAGYTVKSSSLLPDTDFDGLPDFVERDMGTDPNKADSDGDGISDYDEINDLSKYRTIATIFPSMNLSAGPTGGYGTNPRLKDSDGDGLNDNDEIIGFYLNIAGTGGPSTYVTNPLLADTDLDGLNDYAEIKRFAGATNPLNPDTDGDSRYDNVEVVNGTDPLRPDLKVTVKYRSLQLKGGTEHLFWYNYIQGPHQSAPGYLTGQVAGSVSSAERYSELACTTGRTIAWPAPGNYSNVTNGFSGERTFTMYPGETIHMSGTIYQLADCNFSASLMQTINRYDMAFTFDDMLNSGPLTSASGNFIEGKIATETIYGTFAHDVYYEINVQ